MSAKPANTSNTMIICFCKQFMFDKLNSYSSFQKTIFLYYSTFDISFSLSMRPTFNYNQLLYLYPNCAQIVKWTFWKTSREIIFAESEWLYYTNKFHSFYLDPFAVTYARSESITVIKKKKKKTNIALFKLSKPNIYFLRCIYRHCIS